VFRCRYAGQYGASHPVRKVRWFRQVVEVACFGSGLLISSFFCFLGCAGRVCFSSMA
jgi:hypothetical protein